MDSGSDRTHHRDMTAPDLASLIATNKGSRSYERLAADCGGVVTGARLQQMVRDGIKTFPDPDRIRGLAQGLGTTVTEVVAAAARSLGLDVRYGQDPTALVIGGAGTLPPSAREAITGVARELVAAYQVARPEEAMGNAQHPAPMNQAGTEPAPSKLERLRQLQDEARSLTGRDAAETVSSADEAPVVKLPPPGLPNGVAAFMGKDALRDLGIDPDQIAARPGTPDHVDRDETGEGSQDPGGGDPA